MDAQNCSCAKFGKLEGASVNAYVAAFLEEIESASSSPTRNKRYRCRACGREWEKQAPEVKSAGTRPSLVRFD
jgi:hypothetical protein